VKAYLINIYVNPELTDKLNMLEMELTTKIDECDCLIYDCPIDEVFGNPIKIDQVKTIISKKEFLKINKLTPTQVKKKNEIKVEFETENIGEVSNLVKNEVNKIITDESFKDQNRYMSLVAIELVQNALIYKEENKIDSKIELVITEGEENYSVCVTDNFGALSHETLLAKIMRAYKEKTPENKKTGAGLGFSMVLSASDEFVLRSKKNQETIVCSIMNKYKRLKEYKSKSPTLYLRQGV
jgi:anti-sigma regulatory factor (Ser/Thr protein kinase)